MTEETFKLLEAIYNQLKGEYKEKIVKLQKMVKTLIDEGDLTEKEVNDMFVAAIEQEKEWAKYLFKDGSMIGLNEKLLGDYVEWIGCRRMRTLSYHCPYTVSQSNPLPWTEKWISGGNVQVAPQETEITSYITGGVKQDVSAETMKGLSL